jgi:hypothetical protein
MWTAVLVILRQIAVDIKSVCQWSRRHGALRVDTHEERYVASWMSGMATDIIVSYFKFILVQNQPTGSLVCETSFESTRSFITRNLRRIY